jgi:hypothetical protein
MLVLFWEVGLLGFTLVSKSLKLKKRKKEKKRNQ